MLLVASKMQILVISRSLAERTALQALLEAEGFDVEVAASRMEGLAAATTGPPDVVIADVQVLGIDGHAIVRDLLSYGVRRTILLCPRSDRGCLSRGVPCLTKPIDFAELLGLIWQPTAMARHA